MTGLPVLHVPGYSALQNAYANGTREEIQRALDALGSPRPIEWCVSQTTHRVDVPLSLAPKFMAKTLADAIESQRALHDYKARGDGRKVASEIRRGEAWLAARGWAYHDDSRQVRCLTCRRSYARAKAEDDKCPRNL